MRQARKPPLWVDFLRDYPPEGEPQYRAGDLEALPHVFALKLVRNGYGEIREVEGAVIPRRKRRPKKRA